MAEPTVIERIAAERWNYGRNAHWDSLWQWQRDAECASMLAAVRELRQATNECPDLRGECAWLNDVISEAGPMGQASEMSKSDTGSKG